LKENLKNDGVEEREDIFKKTAKRKTVGLERKLKDRRALGNLSKKLKSSDSKLKDKCSRKI